MAKRSCITYLSCDFCTIWCEHQLLHFEFQSARIVADILKLRKLFLLYFESSNFRDSSFGLLVPAKSLRDRQKNLNRNAVASGSTGPRLRKRSTVSALMLSLREVAYATSQPNGQVTTGSCCLNFCRALSKRVAGMELGSRSKTTRVKPGCFL